MIRLLPLPFIFALALIPSPAKGCAVALHEGDSVGIASESAIIVWDEANKMEHFYRRATFAGSAYDFGFLVPTPSTPEVEETEVELFSRMEKLTKPKVEERTRKISPGCFAFSASKFAAESQDAAGGLMVLQEKRVGDHDVVSIKFDRRKGDASQGAVELAAWLVRFGYGFGDNLKEWVEPYVKNDWVITAFRIAARGPGAEPAKGATGRIRDHSAGGPHDVQASPVRMSFKADRPFYPYREPADQRNSTRGSPPRLLRVFFVAAQRYMGIIGDTKAWPGNTVWADKMKDVEKADFVSQSKLKLETIRGDWFVTEFEDRSSPRPGTDEVYFSPSPDQSTVARPPIIIWKDEMDETPWIIGLALCFGLPALVLLIVAIRRRRG